MPAFGLRCSSEFCLLRIVALPQSFTKAGNIATVRLSIKKICRMASPRFLAALSMEHTACRRQFGEFSPERCCLA